VRIVVGTKRSSAIFLDSPEELHMIRSALVEMRFTYAQAWGKVERKKLDKSIDDLNAAIMRIEKRL